MAGSIKNIGSVVSAVRRNLEGDTWAGWTFRGKEHGEVDVFQLNVFHLHVFTRSVFTLNRLGTFSRVTSVLGERLLHVPRFLRWVSCCKKRKNKSFISYKKNIETSSHDLVVEAEAHDQEVVGSETEIKVVIKCNKKLIKKNIPFVKECFFHYYIISCMSYYLDKYFNKL